MVEMTKDYIENLKNIIADKDDAKAQRVPADISQQRHQHQRQAVVQHRPLGHKLQRRQL